jgi:hypothetical protein
VGAAACAKSGRACRGRARGRRATCFWGGAQRHAYVSACDAATAATGAGPGGEGLGVPPRCATGDQDDFAFAASAASFASGPGRIGGTERRASSVLAIRGGAAIALWRARWACASLRSPASSTVI